MHFPRKRFGAPIACAVLATAALFTYAAPANAAITGPPRTTQIAVGTPNAVKNTVKRTTLVRVTTGNVANVTSVKLKFYSGTTLVDEVELTPVSDGLYFYNWDTTAFHYVQARLLASALVNGTEVAISARSKAVQVVNPFMTGKSVVKANKPARFTGKYLLTSQVAHLYQCWDDVTTAADISTSCDTAPGHFVDKLYRSNRVTVTITIRPGSAPHLTNRIVMTVTNGGPVITLLQMPITVVA
jgi:hypothetical protein